MNIPPESVFLVDDLELLRVVGDPLRLKIFRTVRDFNRGSDLCSVRQISDVLGMPPAKLYYHVKLLESHGLLYAAETRIVSGIVEKLYRITAQRISVAEVLFESEKDRETLYPMFAGLINEVLEEIHYTLTAPQKDGMNQNIAIGRHEMILPQNCMTEFSQKMEELLQGLQSEVRPVKGEETGQYTFFYACFPEVKKFNGNLPETPAAEDPA